MKRLLFLMVLVPSFVYAGSYTIYTTPEQDAVLTKAAEFYGIPVEVIIGVYKNDAILALPAKMEREKKIQFLQRYDSLSDAEKQKVEQVFKPVFINSTTGLPK